MTPAVAIEKTRKIQEFRAIVSLIKDNPAPRSFRTLVKELVKKIPVILKALGCLRFVFMPIHHHQWCIIFDSGRALKDSAETTYDFVYRIGRTNRQVRLPDLLNISPDDQIVAVDMAQTTSAKYGTYGTLPFLFAIAGLGGALRMTCDIIWGTVMLKSPMGALIYASLRLMSRRASKIENGLLITTSVSWLAEVLRVVLSYERADLNIVEVLHGAGSQNTGQYFQWVHDQARTPTNYINLIADLPRYAPLKSHMLRDELGEISCNIRLWQGRSDPKVTIPKAVSECHSIVFVGGASIDPNYAKSSYFNKELDMLQILQNHRVGPVFYAPHPIHSANILQQMLPKVSHFGATVQRETTLELILGASIVVGGLSTSLIEAALLDVPSFAYEDFAMLFVPETAELITWNTDKHILARAIAESYRDVLTIDKKDQIAKTAYLASRRCGIDVVIE